MEERLILNEDAFDFYMLCNYHELKLEIEKSKAYVINARKYKPRYPSQRRNYDIQYNRWKALELLEQFRTNVISREEFDTKVKIEKGIPND